ncbi:hypothetical protein Bpfe_016790 [Biomphalaria pfeifferi]|uniref:Uncharacterized protein n=1 Tax=Biomphalaria pfeifferi TaxID=112525 RepID=A0AAD8F806_BIOPF|nr:hypothetical protein Bpfe_016790 [Biomphalaria pfeifferi]
MNLSKLTLSLLCLFCVIVGAEVNKREQTGIELTERQEVVLDSNAFSESTVGTLETKKKDLISGLKTVVSAFCFALKWLPGRSVGSGQDLTNDPDVPDEKRALPLIVIGKALCVANDVYNAAKTFCRDLNGKRDTESTHELVEREQLSGEKEKRDVLSDLARNVCSWLQSNGILRDAERMQELLAESDVDKREFGETKNILAN